MTAPSSASNRPTDQDPLRPVNPLVSRAWVFAAVLAVLLAAALFGYGALFLLFWQGQWQLLFHPSNTVTATPASVGLAFEAVRFDASATGQPRLTGWWLPAAPGAPAADLTVLYLHNETGSLANTLPDLQALHASGVNVFAFDYRGYGQSEWAHPSEKLWREDTAAALGYLEATRHLPLNAVVLCGNGFGASVAADTAQSQPEIRAEILADPRPPALEVLRADPRTRLFPLGLLARDRFEPAAALAHSQTRKLFLLPRADSSPTPSELSIASAAAEPKTIVRIPIVAGQTLLGSAAAQAALRQLFSAIQPHP